MGKLIRPDFGQPRSGNQQEELKEPQTANPVELAKFRVLLDADIRFYQKSEENKEKIRTAQKCGDEMTNFLMDEAGGFSVKAESLELRRATLHTVSLEQLCGYLTESGRSQWLQQPHYYGAIFVEYDERVKTIAFLMHLDHDPRFSSF